MDAETKAIVRTHVASFAPIPDGEWRAFEAILCEKKYGKGDYLVHAGQRFPFIGLVLSGLVRVFYTLASGKEYIRAFSYEGRPIGPYSAMIQDLPSNASMEALEDTHLVCMDYEKFKTLYPRHACWQEFGRRMAEEYLIVRERREYEFMALSATERWELFCEEHGQLIGRVPAYHIAAYLGITPVALSRLMKKWRS